MKGIILGAALAFTAAVQAQDNHYCHDPESHEQWDALIHKYPDDNDLRELVTLREQLCTQVDNGSMTVDVASARFEAARTRLQLKWESQNKAKRIMDTKGHGQGV